MLEKGGKKVQDAQMQKINDAKPRQRLRGRKELEGVLTMHSGCRVWVGEWAQGCSDAVDWAGINRSFQDIQVSIVWQPEIGISVGDLAVGNV